MKGNERNALCTCGSGKKRKRCEPQHPPTPEQMEQWHEEALRENFWRSPAGKRKRQHALLMLGSALAMVQR